jgi:hypothetical protein
VVFRLIRFPVLITIDLCLVVVAGLWCTGAHSAESGVELACAQMCLSFVATRGCDLFVAITSVRMCSLLFAAVLICLCAHFAGDAQRASLVAPGALLLGSCGCNKVTRVCC